MRELEIEKEIADDCMDEGIAGGLNCEVNKKNCEADFMNDKAYNKSCETDKIDSELNKINCELDENVEKQLDVAGLAQAYKLMSSTNDEGNYKDVLCIAIGSLCGEDLHYLFFCT